MRQSIIAAILALGAVLALATAPQPACADKVTVINYYGAAPFVIGGYSYIPLRDVSDFLGAALLWDSIKNRATITYNGREVGLVVGSPVAYLVGSTAALPCAPVLIGGQVYVPSVVLVQHLAVPVVYDVHTRVIRISKGPNAWGTFKVGAPPRGIEVLAGLKSPPGHRVRHERHVRAREHKPAAARFPEAAKPGPAGQKQHEHGKEGKGRGRGNK